MPQDAGLRKGLRRASNLCSPRGACVQVWWVEPPQMQEETRTSRALLSRLSISPCDPFPVPRDAPSLSVNSSWAPPGPQCVGSGWAVPWPSVPSSGVLSLACLGMAHCPGLPGTVLVCAVNPRPGNLQSGPERDLVTTLSASRLQRPEGAPRPLGRPISQRTLEVPGFLSYPQLALGSRGSRWTGILRGGQVGFCCGQIGRAHV